VASIGVSLGLTAATITSKGTLAQKERWLPKLATFETSAPGDHRTRTPARCLRRDEVLRQTDGEDYLSTGRRRSSQRPGRGNVIVVYAKLDEGDAGSIGGTAKRDRKC